MFPNLSSVATSATPAASASTDSVTFVVVGVIVAVLFLGIVIRILRRNRLKK